MTQGEQAKPVIEPPSFFRRKGEAQRPEPAAGLAPGKLVGDFRLVALIGQGGMGQVWEAEQVSLHRTVAVKFVRPERVTEHQLELFAREARAGGRLSHPGIVSVHGYGSAGGLAWIAMEHIEGAWTLRDFLDEVARAEAVPDGYDRHVARFVAEVADAMQAAHEAGVIHRDMKPQNVLITTDDRPKVSDFGLARIIDESALSLTGEFAGTYLYMSPEQVAAKRAGIDHRTDIFSLGGVLYELLALQRPFQGDTEHQVAAQILAKDPPDIRTLRSRVPRDLAVIAGKALEKDRDKRFQTMAELAADLRRFLADEPILAHPPTRLDRTLKWIKRNPAKSSAGAIALLAFLIISTLLVANVRANRALEAKTLALAAKTAESEDRREQAEQNELRAVAGEALAKEQQEHAERKADEVLRLSAMQELDDLVAEADRLWPAHAANLPRYVAWLRKARALAAELPDHQRKLAELEATAERSTGLEGSEWRFADAEDKWWHGQLEKLVSEISALSTAETGLASSGITREHGWGIEKRAEFAALIDMRSVSGAEASALWAEARASIADVSACQAYGGLEISPQLGLLPIGQDPDSGLWEFAHLQTGEPSARDANGRLLVEEETGIVFVLLPGGPFRMGAQSTDPRAPNCDPQAQPDEAPVHDVELSPFFLSKYELTQAQWKRFTGQNPSFYQPPQVPSLVHPVEQVSWTACTELCGRLGLELPSEAQWEYAARGGMTTAWWTGSERESLVGAINIADQAAAQGNATWPAIRDWPELFDGHVVHAPVSQFLPNPFGLHGVHGNVWEWCRDGSDGTYYQRSPSIDPICDPEGYANRVARGGSFGGTASLTRSAKRNHVTPESADYDLGLRPARALDP